MLKKIFDNIYFLSIIKKINTICFGMIATIFLNRALGPALKGEYATILNMISMLTSILYLGISTIYPNYIRKKENWTFSTFIGLVFCQGIIYAALSAVIGIAFHSVSYLIYGLCVTFAVVSMQVLQMSIVNDFKRGTIANIISVSTNAIFLFLMWISGIKNIQVAFLIYIIKELSIVIFSFTIVKKSFKFSEMKIDKWWEIIVTGFIPMVTNLMIVINYKVDVIILQFLDVDYYQIGLYSTGLALAEYGWIVSDVFKDVLIKKTSAEDNIDSVKFCLRISSTVLMCIGVVLWIGSKWILTLLYGADYSAAWLITDVIFFGVFSMSYCKLLIPLYLANGRWRFYFLVLFGAATINIIANFIFIPVMGIYGAALTSIVSYSFAGLLFCSTFVKQYKVKIRDIIFIRKDDISRFIAVTKLLKAKKD